MDDLYTDYSQHKMVGHFFFGTSGLVINDIDLIKQVLIKDFDHFTDRRTFDLDDSVETNKMLLNMLTTSRGKITTMTV